MENRQSPFAFAQSAQARGIAIDAGLRAYMLGIYNYMASALALTGLVALFAAKSPAVMGMLYVMSESGYPVGMTGLGWVVTFAPLVIALGFGFMIQRISVGMAQAVFWGFATVMGLSLASLFLLYTGESIARVFFITAGMFGGMSLYGYTTKRDLTGIGSFLVMGVWGLIIASLVNLFLKSSGLGFAISILGVFIFIGLTAYDTQKLKNLYYQVAGNSEAMAKTAIMGALTLYLDFINLFIMLMRLMGERR